MWASSPGIHLQRRRKPASSIIAMAATSAAASRRSTTSKIPSPTSKPKPTKPKRRSRVFRDAFGRQIRILGLFVLALFIIAFFKIGLPRHSQSPPLPTRPIGFNLSESQVDIKMSDLYDRIAFKDVDGGAWKQGWDVQYKGDEWDKKPLKVFVVPHSHNDPGWIRTVEEYYQEKSRRILSTIVQSLRKDKNRKFIWEEMSYLERWWRDASEAEKKDFIRLVNSGQLEIVGGGWVMNDEANSHYYAIIEQMIEGNLWLKDTVGVIPKNAWAIDPFGHSSTMAYLIHRMGFQNMLIQRTHYEVKKALAEEQNLEFVWRQSWDTGNTTDIFCHMMPFYSYDIPHTCGPEPAICCQFDYWRLPGFGSAQRCPWGYNPQQITASNVQERSEKLLDQYRKKSTLYKTNTLLVPLGDDFRYVTIAEADLQFENYQKIFDYINAHPALKADVQFGTLEDYFMALRNEVGLKGSKKEEGRELSAHFPTLAGDFFTYADREQDYWSGYYVSRPYYKAVDRVLEATLRAADILFSLSSAFCRPSHLSNFPLPFVEKLIDARRTLALFQHHDGITGTAKTHVVVDYAQKMHSALLNLQGFMAQSMGVLLGESVTKGICKDTHLSTFEPEQYRASHDTLPMKKILELIPGKMQRVVLYNPLEEAVNQVVMVLVQRTDVCVMDSEWLPVDSQISPEWGNDVKNITIGMHRLHWQVQIPSMGIQTFFISNSDSSQACKAAELAQLKVYHATDTFACPLPYKCTQPEGELFQIQNQHQTLVFAIRDGLLVQIKNHKDRDEMALKEDIGLYSSRGSGAYLFKPIGEAQSVVQSGGLIIVTEGPLMQEVYTQPKTSWSSPPVTRRFRLYNGEGSVQAFMTEIEYHVELLDFEYSDKEVIARFQTDLDSGRIFYSDLNGFQIIGRETRDKIPLQGNYYPMPSLAFLQDTEGRRFSLHSRQALGVASLKSGSLEVMLDRRLTRDDDRGLGQGVLDNRPTDIVFHLLFESNVTILPEVISSTPRVPSLLSHRVLAQLNYPMYVFLAKHENGSSVQDFALEKRFAPMAITFPCDLHVVSLKVPRPLDFLKSLSVNELKYALTLQRRGWDNSYCKKGRTQCTKVPDDGLDLFSLFHDLSISTARLSSLNLLHDFSTDVGHIQSVTRKQRGGSAERTGRISVSPMELQSLKLDLISGG